MANGPPDLIDAGVACARLPTCALAGRPSGRRGSLDRSEDMSKASVHIDRNFDILVRAAESRPREIVVTGSLNGRAPKVTEADRKLARAVWARNRAA